MKYLSTILLGLLLLTAFNIVAALGQLPPAGNAAVKSSLTEAQIATGEGYFINRPLPRIIDTPAPTHASNTGGVNITVTIVKP